MAIVELVDGPHDTRFSLAARAIALARLDRKNISLPMAKSIEKIRTNRPDGEAELEALAAKMSEMEIKLREDHDEKVMRNEVMLGNARELFQPQKSTLQMIRERTGWVSEDIIEKTSICRPLRRPSV